MVPDLAQLYEVRLQTVHLFVCLAVVHGLGFQVLLQSHFAIVDLPKPRLELLVVHHYALDLLVIAFAMEALYVVFAVALLGVALLFKDLDGLIKGLNGRPLHLDLLQKDRETEGENESRSTAFAGQNLELAHLGRLCVIFIEPVVVFALVLVLIVVLLQFLPNSINVVLLYQLILRLDEDR